MKTNTIPAPELEQKSNSSSPTGKLKKSKSHTHTLYLSNNKNVGVASKVNSHSATEDFLAADLLLSPTLIKGYEKRMAMNFTIKVLREFNHEDFHGCITFLEQRKTDDSSGLISVICCETFYFNNDDYRISLPGEIYKTKTIKTDLYKYVKTLHEITFLNKGACKLTHDSDNSSELAIPLANVDETTCISAAIFTSSKENSAACDASTFFYSIFKKASELRKELVEQHEKEHRIKYQDNYKITSTGLTSYKNTEIEAIIEATLDNYTKKLILGLQENKEKLILFKKIYNALYINQRGWKSSNFLASPDALYLSVQYLENLAKDAETKDSRREKAWALTKKYFSSKNRSMLEKEICEYAEENSSEVTEYISKISGIMTAIPGIFSLFPSRLSSKAGAEKKNESSKKTTSDSKKLNC